MRQLRSVMAGLLLMIFMTLSLTGCEKSLEEQIAEQLELGQKYLAELNYEEAIVAFTKAIELEAKTEAAYMGLAEAYEGSGDVWQAAQTLETGYGLFPEEDMKNSLAETYKRALEFFAEDMERQIEIYYRLMELFPDEEYYQKLAEIYEMQDNMEAAKKILEDGIAATDSEELKEKLEELNGPPRSETMTVEGLALYLPHVYQESWESYIEKNEFCSIYSYGIRFSEPLIVTIAGETASVTEAELYPGELAGKIESNIGFKFGGVAEHSVQLTGYFTKVELEEEFLDVEHLPDGLTYWEYYPTGPYIFWIDEGYPTS